MIILGLIILILSILFMINQKNKIIPQLVVKGHISKIVNFTALLSIFLIFFNQLFFFADAGTTYTLQHKFYDSQYTIFGESGLQFRGFAKVTKVDAELVIKTLTPTQYNEYKEGQRIESDETYIIAANQVSFNDKIGVWLNTTTIIDCSPDEEGFSEVVIKGKSESNIVYQRIIPLINEVHGNMVKLFGTEDYIEGAKVIASQMFWDQLQNGKYAVIEDENYNAETNEVSADSTKVKTTTSNKKMEKRYIVHRYDKGHTKAGEIIRTSEGLRTYGFQVRSAQIESEEYHQDFEVMLNEVRDIQATTQKLKQQTEQEIRTQEYNLEKGEALKIQERLTKEKEQIGEIIQAETDAAKAKFFKEQQQNLLDGEKIKSLVVQEQQKQIKALRNAGIDPVIELEMLLANKVDIMKAAAGPNGFTLPTNLIQGMGANGETGVLESILSVKLMEDQNTNN